MNYRLLPFSHHSFLNQLLYDVYVLNTDQEASLYSTAPNGIVGLSVITRGNSQILIDNKWQDIPTISVYGLINHPDVIQLSPYFNEIAIGFKPYFLQLLVRESMSQIVGGANCDAYDLFDLASLQWLKERLFTAESDAQILSAIELFIRRNLNLHKVDQRLLHAMNLIYTQGITSVEAISQQINLSSTSVRNLFRDGIGQSPKNVMRILRTNKVLKSDPKSFSHFTELGYQAGYFDQSHFIHEFKGLIGMTPSQYFNHPNLAFDFYNYGRWEENIFEAKIVS